VTELAIISPVLGPRQNARTTCNTTGSNQHLGHGETMCSRCFITNQEAAALGVSGSCDVTPPSPRAGNDNATQEAIDAACIHDDDDGDDEEYDMSEDCGRWGNGRLLKQCRKAGSEECDWECPIGLP
jgi:hypothetical protein